jgi:beta-lactamase class C
LFCLVQARAKNGVNFCEFYSAFFADGCAQDVMKILKEYVKSSLKFSAQFCAKLVALSLWVCFSGGQAYAQNEKQISYPVAVPIERAAASSARAAPAVVIAPAPIIRPIEDAASLPPSSVRKAVSKKTTKAAAEKSESKTSKGGSAKKLRVSAKASATKKTVAAKPKTPAKKISTNTTTKKTTTAPSVTKKSEPATTSLVLTPTKPPTIVAAPIVAKPEAPPAPLSSPAISSLSPALKAAIVPVAAAALISSAEFGDQPEASSQPSGKLSEGEIFSPDDELTDAEIKTPVTVVKTKPLPISNQREAFVAKFKDYVETKIVPRAPGFALAVIVDGKVKVLETYGLKRFGKPDLVNANTAFRLASVSKSFASSAAALLVQDGLITWDTKIVSILPDMQFSNPRYGNELTVRDILSQSTGLPTHTGDNYIEEDMEYDDVLKRVALVNFICPPGKCYNYQNVTYSLIGKIITKKTGKTYEQFVNERILKPLGMHATSVGMTELKANGNFALPHVPTTNGWLPVEINERYYRLNPAAGVNASISDMSRWVLAHMGHNPDVLSPIVLKSVHAKVTRNTPAQNHYGNREGVTDSHYGLGWRVFDYRGDKNFVHHGGGVKGFRSEVVFNPDLQIGMVVLTNTERLGGDIIFKFLDAYEDDKRGEKRFNAEAGQAQPAKKKATKK